MQRDTDTPCQEEGEEHERACANHIIQGLKCNDGEERRDIAVLCFHRTGVRNNLQHIDHDHRMVFQIFLFWVGSSIERNHSDNTNLKNTACEQQQVFHGSCYKKRKVF